MGKFKTSKSHSEINWLLKKFLELNGIPKDFRPKRTSSPIDLNRGIIPSPDSESSLEILENVFPIDSISSKEVTDWIFILSNNALLTKAEKTPLKY